MNVEEEIKNLKSELDVLKSLLQKLIAGGKKLDLTLNVKELALLIRHLGDEEITIDTSTNNGKVMYCAFKDFEGKPSTEVQMREKLAERGWGMTHGTISPLLSSLVKRSWLIIDKSARPATWRLPEKVKVREL